MLHTMDEKPTLYNDMHSDDGHSKLEGKREAHLVRKIDIRLMPWVCLTFLCAAIDK